MASELRYPYELLTKGKTLELYNQLFRGVTWINPGTAALLVKYINTLTLLGLVIQYGGQHVRHNNSIELASLLF